MTFDLIPFIFIFSSYPSLSPTIRIQFPKHLCSCSYHPEILTAVSSVLLQNVHTGINVCCLCSFCDFWGSYIVCLCFLNDNMVKPVQNDAVFV